MGLDDISFFRVAEVSIGIFSVGIDESKELFGIFQFPAVGGGDILLAVIREPCPLKLITHILALAGLPETDDGNGIGAQRRGIGPIVGPIAGYMLARTLRIEDRVRVGNGSGDEPSPLMEDLRPWDGANEEMEGDSADFRFPFLGREIGELQTEGYLWIGVIGIEFDGDEGVFPECWGRSGADIGEDKGVLLDFHLIGVDILQGAEEDISDILSRT